MDPDGNSGESTDSAGRGAPSHSDPSERDARFMQSDKMTRTPQSNKNVASSRNVEELLSRATREMPLTEPEKLKMRINCDMIAHHKGIIVATARMLYAITNSGASAPHGASPTFEAITRFINSQFDLRIPTRNISNFANRATFSFNTSYTLGACMYFIYCYIKIYVTVDKSDYRLFTEILDDVDLISIFEKLIKLSQHEFELYLMSPDGTRSYAQLEQFLISTMHISHDTAAYAKTLMLGDASHRTFYLYRNSNVPGQHGVVSSLEVKGHESNLLSYRHTYPSGEALHVETYGLVFPMKQVICFVGARIDGAGLEIIMLPISFYREGAIVKTACGIMLYASDTGEHDIPGGGIIASRVYLAASTEYPVNEIDALVKKESLPDDIVRSIENSMHYIIDQDIFDDKGRKITRLDALKYRVDQLIDEIGEQWPIREKTGSPINPLSEGVMRAIGGLASRQKWTFRKTEPDR